jgi:vacuolar-type H+-ATPase subunit H
MREKVQSRRASISHDQSVHKARNEACDEAGNEAGNEACDEVDEACDEVDEACDEVDEACDEVDEACDEARNEARNEALACLKSKNTEHESRLPDR